jgi:UDP-2-acetamido-2-deoxy-ribo-hexuluronate aminotransferase
VAPGNTHVYAQYTIRVPERDKVAAQLKSAGIPSAVYYPKCLHEQPVFSSLGYKWGDFPESEKASREVLSLPMHSFLSESDQDAVVATLGMILSHQELCLAPNARNQSPAAVQVGMGTS